MKKMIFVSACLAGENCKYDGKNNLVPEIRRLVKSGAAIAACPEVEGGLSVPRVPCELQNGRVLARDGEDVTEEFLRGAEKCLLLCKKNQCSQAVLKAKSPSCGKGHIYNGRFEGVLTEGDGVFARMLLEEGIEVLTEEEFLIADQSFCS